jgi:hypothetical protein
MNNMCFWKVAAVNLEAALWLDLQASLPEGPWEYQTYDRNATDVCNYLVWDSAPHGRVFWCHIHEATAAIESDNIDFFRLVAQVRQIDPGAADWLLAEAVPGGRVATENWLSSCFVWASSPQGDFYWRCIIEGIANGAHHTAQWDAIPPLRFVDPPAVPAPQPRPTSTSIPTSRTKMHIPQPRNLEELLQRIERLDPAAAAYVRERNGSSPTAQEVIHLFTWSATPQGEEYWRALHRRIQAGEGATAPSRDDGIPGVTRDFRIGDRARIRQWDDMELQFGRTPHGAVACQCSFTNDMRHLCGEVVTITGGYDRRIELEFRPGVPRTDWSYSLDMIEPIMEVAMPQQPEEPVESVAAAPPVPFTPKPVTTLDKDGLINELTQTLDRYSLFTNQVDTLVNMTISNKSHLHEILRLDPMGRAKISVPRPAGDRSWAPDDVQYRLNSWGSDYGFTFDYDKRVIRTPDGREHRPIKFLKKLQDKGHDLNIGRNIRGVVTGDSYASDDTFWCKLGELFASTSIQLYISVNPADIITCSTNTPFSSCLRVDGEYFNGAVASAVDEFSVLVYTGTPEKKLGRQFAYVYPAGQQFYASRVYGNLPDYMQKAARLYLEAHLSLYLGIPDRWVVGGTQDHGSGPSGAGYLDGGYFKWVRPHRDITHVSAIRVELGDALCLKCGGMTDHRQEGLCHDCGEPEYDCHCHHCGEGMHDGDAYYAEDNNWCEYCYNERFRTCVHCGEPGRVEDGMHHNGNFYCEGCTADQLSTCDRCDSTHLADESVNVGTDYWCQHCADNYATCCDRCGDYVRTADIISVGDDTWCEDCAAEYADDCSDCGDTFSKSDLTDGLCAACHEAAEEDEAAEEEEQEEAAA